MLPLTNHTPYLLDTQLLLLLLVILFSGKLDLRRWYILAFLLVCFLFSCVAKTLHLGQQMVAFYSYAMLENVWRSMLKTCPEKETSCCKQDVARSHYTSPRNDTSLSGGTASIFKSFIFFLCTWSYHFTLKKTRSTSTPEGNSIALFCGCWPPPPNLDRT